MTNSVDPDQTAPNSLIWVYTVFPDLSVRKLRIITITKVTYHMVYTDFSFWYSLAEVVFEIIVEIKFFPKVLRCFLVGIQAFGVAVYKRNVERAVRLKNNSTWDKVGQQIRHFHGLEPVWWNFP